MNYNSVRIPGKVMLSGEYAVLHGGSAVLCPVPRFLEISEVQYPPITPYPRAVQEALRYPIRGLDDFEDQFGTPYLLVDRSELLELNDRKEVTKLGLGSSAAEAVGTIVLRYKRAGIPWSQNRSEIARSAVESHRQAQGGRGSGADVAACALGEPVRFTREKDKYSIELIRHSKTNYNIPLHLVWSRYAANTRDLVDMYEEWRKKDKSSKLLVSKLVELSNNLARSWFIVSQPELFELIDQFNMIMQETTDAAGMPYKLPIHEELEAWALSYGGRAKPTGAGGGDMILLIGNLPLNHLDELIIPLDIEKQYSS